MNRNYYIDLANKGLCAPVGAHLVLHTHADHDAILVDGKRLGDVIAETARKYKCPMAIPLMDLTLEKAALLSACGVPEAEIDSYHFTSLPPAPSALPEIKLNQRMKATCDGITHIAKTYPDILPIGMCIGPFSLMTKLITDPIMPVFMAGTGLTAEDDDEVALVERLLEIGEHVIHLYLKEQIKAGAKAIFVCEPAANLVYFSPKQQEETGYEVFKKYVMEPMKRFAALLKENNVDMIFHDCGELTNEMVRLFGTLNPSIISLGNSRNLWEDTALLPKDTVIYGNLPSKRFYSKQLTTADVEKMASDLLAKMKATGHPFILGTECDVLSVPGSEAEIMSKVDAFMKLSK